MRNVRERAHARSKPKAKKQAKGKAGCRKLYNTRERSMCAGNKGCSYRVWRQRIMRSVKKKVRPCAYNTHKKRVLQAVSTGFMRAFAYKASTGRKIFIMRKGMCV